MSLFIDYINTPCSITYCSGYHLQQRSFRDLCIESGFWLMTPRVELAAMHLFDRHN